MEVECQWSQETAGIVAAMPILCSQYVVLLVILVTSLWELHKLIVDLMDHGAVNFQLAEEVSSIKHRF